MCDICVLKCEGCEKKAEIHIGDFSVPRESISIYCPDCRKKAMDHLAGKFEDEERGGQFIVFTSSPPLIIDRRVWFFIIPLPRDIHFN